MKRNTIKFVAILTLILLIASSCGKDKGRNRNVTVQLGPYTTVQNNKFIELLLPSAHASVTSLKFCFKRLRFKSADSNTADPLTASDNVNFDLGEVTISSGSTSLGTIVLPEGTYKRIEFDLENHCASGKSIQLTNSNGVYSSTERITIKFSGSFTANADITLDLDIQQILTQLNSYNGSVSLKTSAEGVSGMLLN